MTSTTRKEYIIDAKSEKLGRVASRIAALLVGKSTGEFQRNRVPLVRVTVKNASLLFLNPKKRRTKTYVSYSGYPGGLKRRSLQEVVSRRGIAAIIKRAVHGMLPKNKLQKRFIKNLIIIP